MVKEELDSVENSKAESIFELMVENTQFGMSVSTMEGKILDLNPALHRMFGYTDKAEFIKAPSTEYYYDLEDRKEVMAQLTTKGYIRNFEFRVKRKDDEIFWISVSAHVIESKDYGKLLLTTHVDVTERKKTESSLQMRTTALESSIAAFGMANKEGRITYVNPAYLKMWGYSHIDEVLGQGISVDMIDPNLGKQILMEVKEKGFIEVETDATKKDGTPISLHIFVTQVKDNKNINQGFVASFIDITKAKEEERKRKETEGRLEDILLSNVDWIWELNKEGEYVFVAGNVKGILGYSPEELLGKTPFDLMPKDEKENISKIFHEIVVAKERIVDLENWNLTKNGERICLLTNAVPMIDQSGDIVGFRGVDKDITEKKRQELELKHSMITKELVGQMFRDLKTIGDLSNRTIFLAGKKLASKLNYNNFHEYLDSFKQMGLGELELSVDNSTNGRWVFTGNKLVENLEEFGTPTGHYALGFLCGTVYAVIGEEEVAGVEMECQSVGDELCKFMIQKK